MTTGASIVAITCIRPAQRFHALQVPWPAKPD